MTMTDDQILDRIFDRIMTELGETGKSFVTTHYNFLVDFIPSIAYNVYMMKEQNMTMTDDQILDRIFDRIMTELGETGKSFVFKMDLERDRIRAAAKDEGVQVRFDACANPLLSKVSLRKVGRGH